MIAVIYLADYLALGRTVAVKILRPSLTNDPEFLKRFRQEARNVANLSHPNIVTVHDVGQDGNTHYMVMEYVDGEDLKKLIRASAPFTIDRALSIAIKICAGVGYAHRANLVHADVKPQNVLVTKDDVVKVTDFGIAQALSLTQPQERQRGCGQPHYFAHERAGRARVTAAERRERAVRDADRQRRLSHDTGTSGIPDTAQRLDRIRNSCAAGIASCKRCCLKSQPALRSHQLAGF